MYQYGPLLSFARKKIAYRWTDWCLRYLLLVMCAHPFAKEALTLHLARSEGHERYFGCNLMHHKVLASSQQHLMAEAPTMLLLLVTFKLTFEANLSKEARLDNTTMLWALGAYFVYITIWLARFLMKFRKPRDA